MWNVVVLAVMIAAAGVYTTRNFQTLGQAHEQLASADAAEMGVYRNAVIDYFSDHNVLNASVSTATLKSGGYLPAWSRLYQQSAPLTWANFRDAGGVIYVYGTSLPPQNLAAELARLANNSVLLGIYDSTHTTLQSPVYGETDIPVSAISSMSIPNGAPVWLAMTK
ncbi:type IV pilus biogenesis protein PilM [Herbaspirillum sp. LeCh32-8]|uniref:type IV pilus biogenesis protein PilM n=1 Tax=Herbaspirillum sp. LeCh32-8 TaxID=2821356 RepID=UPI001AE27661|nr:type IV pilus biogenesis protein PilM [Herbaspirillum sp. LeCh32-8]MBP0597292.1 type IV pilus biogenesis protein PilM [Herbaspirillum sp. LeCh32-8]